MRALLYNFPRNKFMTPDEEKKDLRKRTFKCVLASFLGLILICLIIFIILLIISLNNSKSQSERKNYSYDVTTEVLDSFSSLDADGNFIYTSPKDNNYYVTVKFSSNGNAGLGSYTEKNYLYSCYGEVTNILTITFDVFDKEDKPVSEYTDLSVELSLGNKDDHNLTEDYEISENVITYCSLDDIYVYSFKMSLKV